MEAKKPAFVGQVEPMDLLDYIEAKPFTDEDGTTGLDFRQCLLFEGKVPAYMRTQVNRPYARQLRLMTDYVQT